MLSAEQLRACPRATVYKLTINEATKRERVDTLHTGVIIGQTSTHYKVWNPDKNSGDGSDPELAALYAKNSRRIWCVVHPSVAEQKAKKA